MSALHSGSLIVPFLCFSFYCNEWICRSRVVHYNDCDCRPRRPCCGVAFIALFDQRASSWFWSRWQNTIQLQHRSHRFSDRAQQSLSQHAHWSLLYNCRKPRFNSNPWKSETFMRKFDLADDWTMKLGYQLVNPYLGLHLRYATIRYIQGRFMRDLL